MIDINPELNNKIVKKPKNNLYATGKRKNSIARVWLTPNGKGEIKINKKNLNEYFARSFLKMLIKKPFETVNNNNFNANVSVKGGGLSGQASAIKLAISKALVNYDPKFRVALKKKTFLLEIVEWLKEKNMEEKKQEKAFNFLNDKIIP